MTDDIKRLTSRVIGVTVFKRWLAGVEADARESLQMAMDAGDRKAGYAGDARIGQVTLTDPKATWRVKDGDAFRAWVKANHPEEIVTTESVRSSFETAVLSRIQGGGEIPDGVDLVEGTPTLQVRPDKDAAEAIAAELDRRGVSFTEWLDRKEIEP